jgi:CRISPR-associated protein Cst1
MLRYTGHPIADVGVATICAFCEKTDPSALIKEDLLGIAGFLEREYFSGKLSSYLTCVFPNSAYVNPTTGAAKKKLYKLKVLYGIDEPPDPAAEGLRCAFSNQPAARIAYRQHVPLLTGEDVLNFFPAGIGGLPISAEFLLAVQAFPLGARRCHGRALAVHCPDDQSLTYAFASRFLRDNQRLLILAQKSGEKYEDAKAPKTLVIDALIDIGRSRQDWTDSDGEPACPPSVSVYHLTNSGQGPDIDVFELPSEVISFILLAARAGTGDVWKRIVTRSWEVPATASATKSSRRAKKGQADAEPPQPAPAAGKNRNFLYEDLFSLPHRAARFIRTYFLRRAWRFAGPKNDPRRAYSVTQELELVSWPLTRLFLREVIGMEKRRIEAIRELADRIASHINADNDRRLFRRLYLVNRYDSFRNLLLKSSMTRVKSAQPPLISLDEFLIVFEETDEIPRIDWRLSRDLVLIRLIEELYKQGWFTKEPDALEGLDDSDEEATDSIQ